MVISDTIKYVGVNDHEIDLFEGQYVVPNGMAYNSYAILDEKIAIMDSVDAHFTQEWFANIDQALDGRKPDYLVVQHMEPDHSGSIHRFVENYPEAKIVASARAFVMMKNFFGTDFADRQVVVGENDTLCLGSRTLTFITAAMVHWPEVIMTYDSQDKVLFSADGFGKFGALDVEEDWACEARRYYIGIVGKYGVPVQAVLKKAAGLDIQTICPLHGPVLTENLGYYLDLYNIWSSYAVEEEGVVIAYTSVYGNTKKAVELLAEQLRAKGVKVVVNDLARCDMAEAVEDAFRYSKLVLATTTYNGDIFPFMRTFIDHLTERNYSNRTVAFIENGSWAPAAARIMKGMLEKSKNLTYTAAGVKIVSALNEASTAQLTALAEELCGEAAAAQPAAEVGKKFVCKICGYVYEGETLPADFICPLCKRGVEEFEEVK
ncbi:MAG: MBL fold metallo-hydrolase [Ruminococcaceae bacterium]|nr:MBL fold metallo-hydrolase [Oscillospiraceae bacterium]